MNTKIRCSIALLSVICIAVPLNSARAADDCASISESAGIVGNCCGCCVCLKTLLCCETLCLDPPTDQFPHQPYSAVNFSYYDRPSNMEAIQRRMTQSRFNASRTNPWSTRFFDSIYREHAAARSAIR